MMPVHIREVQYIHKEYTEHPPPPADIDFLLKARFVMQQHDVNLPDNVKDAVKFYILLWTVLEND